MQGAFSGTPVKMTCLYTAGNTSNVQLSLGSEPLFLRDDIKEALEKEERDQKAWMETPGLKFGSFPLPVRRGFACCEY